MQHNPIFSIMARYARGSYVQIVAEGKKMNGRFGQVDTVDQDGKHKVLLLCGNTCTVDSGPRVSLDITYLHGACACCICGLVYKKDSAAACQMCDVFACMGCIQSLEQDAASWKCLMHAGTPSAMDIPPAPTAPLPPGWVAKYSARKRAWYFLNEQKSTASWDAPELVPENTKCARTEADPDSFDFLDKSPELIEIEQYYTVFKKGHVTGAQMAGALLLMCNTPELLTQCMKNGFLARAQFVEIGKEMIRTEQMTLTQVFKVFWEYDSAEYSECCKCFYETPEDPGAEDEAFTAAFIAGMQPVAEVDMLNALKKLPICVDAAVGRVLSNIKGDPIAALDQGKTYLDDGVIDEAAFNKMVLNRFPKFCAAPMQVAAASPEVAHAAALAAGLNAALAAGSPALLGLLHEAEALAMSEPLLRASGIGKALRSAAKARGGDEACAAKAAAIIFTWKSQLSN